MATETRGKTNRARRTQKFNPVPWLIGLAIVALIAIPIVINYMRASGLPGEKVPSLGNTHIPEGSAVPEYNSNPPTSGPHYGNIAQWGSYDYEVPDPLLIHNMEDGGVILWYRMGDAEHNNARISELEEASRGYRRVIIAPRENLDTTYALTAWTRLDKFDTFDAERIRTFLQTYEGIDHHVRQ
jgi:hypothetical protein